MTEPYAKLGGVEPPPYEVPPEERPADHEAFLAALRKAKNSPTLQDYQLVRAEALELAARTLTDHTIEGVIAGAAFIESGRVPDA